MRQTKAHATAGVVSRRTLLSRQTITLVACLAAALWIAYTFAQEAMLSHQLSREEAQLERQNVQLAADNTRYQRDILSLASGAGLEEQARLNGYARPDEKVFLIVGSAATTATAQPVVHASDAPSVAHQPAPAVVHPPAPAVVHTPVVHPLPKPPLPLPSPPLPR